MKYLPLLLLTLFMSLFIACEKLEAPECYSYILGTYDKDTPFSVAKSSNILILEELEDKDKVSIYYEIQDPQIGRRFAATIVGNMMNSCNDIKIDRQVASGSTIEGSIYVTMFEKNVEGNDILESHSNLKIGQKSYHFLNYCDR